MKKSLKKHIIELLEESGKDLSIEEIISELTNRSVNKTKQQIRNALNNFSCKEIARTGKEQYNLLNRVVNGSYYRYTLTEEAINNGMLPCDRELLFVFDPYITYDDRGIKFYSGGNLFLETELKFYGPNVLPRRKVMGLNDFYGNKKLASGDDLIIGVINVDKGEYEIIPLKRELRDEQVISKKNKEISNLAEQILNRIDAKCCWPHELLRRVFAEYSFKNPCPLDHLSNILKGDKRFLIHDISVGKKNMPSMDEIFLADKVIPDEYGIPVLKSNIDSENNDFSGIISPEWNSFAGYKVNDNFIKVYQFKITLMEIKPPVWRRIQVPETYTFWDLHIVIQGSMGWMDSHLHEFRVRHPRIGKEIYLGIPVDEDENDPHRIFPDWEYRIADFFGEYNKEILYVYDFGDDWRHMVTFEDIKIREKNTQYPLCLDGARACPPEDVGSTGGYENFLKIIKNPRHKEYKHYMEWASSQIEVKDEYQPCKKGKRNRMFDPKHFDIEEIVFDDPAERIKNLSVGGL